MSQPARTDRSTDRHAYILRAAALAGHVSVRELSRELGVSEVSIRRDLEQLEQGGLLLRVRGGAEALTRAGQLSQFDARLLQNARVKVGIGRAAAAQVAPGDAILADSGTTVLESVRHIPRQLLETGGLTVVTRSLVIASSLRAHRHVRLVVLGGVYLHAFDTFVGSQTEAALAELHVRTLLMGTDGVSAERGLTTDNLLEAGLYRLMARAAERVVVVADSSKIGVDRLQATLQFSEIHTFITDAGAPPAFVALLRERGVEVIQAPGTPAD